MDEITRATTIIRIIHGGRDNIQNTAGPSASPRALTTKLLQKTQVCFRPPAGAAALRRNCSYLSTDPKPPQPLPPTFEHTLKGRSLAHIL